jgi:hypothetical protein
MAILLKTALVCVSCIQNTQIRGETTAKVFGKVDTFWTYQRARYSSVTASSQLGSLSAARAEEGTGEYLLTEACRLSRSWEGTCMPEVLHVRCTSKGTGEGGGEGVREGGAIGVCGATGGTTIEGTSSRNS